MKSVIIIPSRWKSSRFEGKSLALIDGVPMIQRVYERAIKSKEADDVIIATDDKRIFNFCKKNKLKVIITSKNAKNGAERISFATRKIDSKIFVNVQGDCPLTNPKSIDKVIFCLKNNISKGYHVSAGCATDNNLKQDKRNSLGFVVILVFGFGAIIGFGLGLPLVASLAIFAVVVLLYLFLGCCFL